jgi:hypothetical protein
MKSELLKKIPVALLALFATVASVAQQAPAKNVTIRSEVLLDKVKGGWAGQTIGVTFGGPYEFRYLGTMIGDYQSLEWFDGYLKKTMLHNPGLYDDLYMDLTFVDVFEKHGLDASVDLFANAYAEAGYMLWHANQVGRYNILNGIKAPQSGHWLSNPHADCIDYQIESDFAGLMSPGMPNTAAAISDKIGHIMNYGDGWYGGVFVGSMYTIAFHSTDVNYIVTEALKSVPVESNFYKCINDVIGWHKKYPNDWKQTWFEVQRKWTDDIGCPDGVHTPFNIDATVNAAYVVIGLLYGEGDFTRSLEISTRCGQDADCNPSTVGGILGTLLGYEKIPAYWKLGLKEAEDIDFKYTTISLNDVYKIGYDQALQNIKKNGGSVNGDKVTIAVQKPVPVRLEKSFEGHYPMEKTGVKFSDAHELNFDFDGIGFVIRGEIKKTDKSASDESYVLQAELYIDGQLVESPKLPVSFITRRHELAWKYKLPKGKHSVRFRILNPVSAYQIHGTEVILYSDQPKIGMMTSKTTR